MSIKSGVKVYLLLLISSLLGLQIGTKDINTPVVDKVENKTNTKIPISIPPPNSNMTRNKSDADK